MGTLFRIVLITAPVLAVVFFYVIMKQSQMDYQMKKEEVKFDREWSEQLGDNDISLRAKHKERAKKAEEELWAMEEKEKEMDRKVEQFEAEFEKAIQDFEKEKKEVKK